MSPTSPQGLRTRLRQRLRSLHRRDNDSSCDTSADSSASTACPKNALSIDSSGTNGSVAVQDGTATSVEQARGRSTDLPVVFAGGSSSVCGSASAALASTSSLHSTVKVVSSPIQHGTDLVNAPSDLWSRAYLAAVQSMGQDVDVTILEGHSIAQLFKELEEVDKDATGNSVFLRGVHYLRSIQVPLERFKLALDLAAPLTAIEPTTSAVFGVIRGVTAVAISISTADLEFAKQIGEMLEHIQYIDDCDTLGQKEDRADIHRALVSVYQKLLEFYVSAHGLLMKKGARLLLAVVSDTGTLPSIVADFLTQAEHLRKIVEKVTLDIVTDIKAMLYDEKISQWLGRDTLAQQSCYHNSLHEIRAEAACTFLLESPEFRTWYRSNESRQLVILGDLGSGKSVTMSFLIDQLCQWKQHQLPQPVVLYHYCQSDESGDVLQILSSLILSFLSLLEGLKKPFFEWYKHALSLGNIQPATNVHKLSELFQRLVGDLDRPLCLLIDGLDECSPESRGTLLELLRNLSQKTLGLKVVLSSRPWEEILDHLEGMPKIYIIPDAERDRIIIRKTVETKLPRLMPVIKQLVVEKLSSSAQGCAIWTKMTIELIAARKIFSHGRMQDFLENMPQPKQLSKLYADLFRRCCGDEPEIMDMASTALQLLAVARRRLNILEIAWAVALRTAGPNVTTVAEVAGLVDHQCVMGLIQPFIATVDHHDLKKRQVSLVHQSAKDFILSHWATLGSDLNTMTPTARSSDARLQETSRLEERIMSLCVDYLLLDEIDQIYLFSFEQIVMDELPQDPSIFSDDDDGVIHTMDSSWENWEEGMTRYDPADRGFGEFFVYASCYWISHFGSVKSDPLPDLSSVVSLCRPNSTRLRNWTSQNSRPDCVLKARFRFDGRIYDPLSITSLYGSEALLAKMVETSDISSGEFLPNTSMLAAEQILQWGDVTRLRTLFYGRGTGKHLRNIGFFRRIIESWRFFNKDYNPDWDAAFDLVNDVQDTLVTERWGNELLVVAARFGCEPVVARLMVAAEHNTDLKEELLRND